MKVYRVSPIRMAIMPVIFGVFCIALSGGAAWVGDPGERLALLGASGIVAFIGVALFPLLWYPKLIVSSEGIELRQVSWRISVSWSNVKGVELCRSGEGLFLREPLRGHGNWALQVGRFLPAWYTAEQTELVAQGLWFPIGPFAWWLRHGDLLETLKQHLPHLKQQGSGLNDDDTGR